MNIRFLNNCIEIDYVPVARFICPEWDIPGNVRAIMDVEHHQYMAGLARGRMEARREFLGALDKVCKEGLITGRQRDTLRDIINAR